MSAICSDPSAAGRGGGGPLRLLAALGVLLLHAVAGIAPLQAQGLRLTQEEALGLAFPAPLVVERKTAFLTEPQLAHARVRAGKDVEIAGRVVTYYVARRGGAPAGVAYFDGHRVRTLPEVVMFVVSPAGRIERAEVLRFQEPPEYEAPGSWIAQLRGRALDGDLSLKGGIVNMTGATLTSQAMVRAARRVLALHEVIRPFDEPQRAAEHRSP